MLLFALTAFATDSGIQRLYDREVECGQSVEPPPDARTCETRVREALPDDGDPTWAIAIAPPGKLFVSMHMPAIDWGHVYRVDVPRAFDPFVVSTGVLDDSPACPEEKLFYLHLQSERGPVTKQVCAGLPWEGSGEVLLESHRKLPSNTWVPIWAHVPDEDARAEDVKSWFLVQIYVSTTGATPDRPEQHPYVSPAVTRAWVPKPLPMRKKLMLVEGPKPPVEDERVPE